ncbi:peptidoglycan-binding domain-containing protein [Sneathiella sp.]|uniref:peptidoglycan-binding domain-containing protein n=1 Tax=Sneathiella sp. TaxID=1964365 RepID=UPI0025E8FA77|nr:peptidoglycan-binding domain-containing protein [Sneathiella sp.]
MPKKILASLLILSAALFIAGGANASWLDKLKDTATELTDKAAEALKEAEPESPTTSDGEGQAKKPATTTAPAAPKAPAQSTVTAPSAPKTAAPAPAAPSGNNDTALVKATQTELKRLGYKIGVDGAYGPNTRKQIIAFEQSQSLEPTGDASVELLAKLKETPTPAAEPATTTTTTAAPAPKAEEPKAPEPKVEKAAAPATAKKSLNPHDYDRAYLYEGSAPQLQGAWLLIKDREPERFYAEIKGDELFAQHSLSGMQLPPGVKIDIREEIGTTFRKTDSYDPPSVVLIRFGGTEITAKNISGGGSTKLRFHAKGPEVAALLGHVQAGNDFEFRVDNFEPFLYSEDWTTFSSPPPEIAAAKQAEKDKQAAAMAAAKAEKEQKAAYAGTLSPEGKMIYENCEQNYSAKTFYDCRCLAENSESYIGAAIDSRTKGLKTVIAAKEDALKKNLANPNLTAEKKAQLEDGTRKYLAKQKADVAKIEDRANWDNNTRRAIVNSVELNIYKDSMCKVGGGMREKEYKTCMGATTLSNMKGNKTPEEFCTCSANKAAELWLASNGAYSSKVAVNVPVQARNQCRN